MIDTVIEQNNNNISKFQTGASLEIKYIFFGKIWTLYTIPAPEITL